MINLKRTCKPSEGGANSWYDLEQELENFFNCRPDTKLTMVQQTMKQKTIKSVYGIEIMTV